MKFRTQIVKLNKARYGAIGEYLYHLAVPDAIEVHENGWDFLLNKNGIENGIDVKTTLRYITIKCPTKLQIASPKDINEIRANVIFYNDCISIHYDDAPICVFTWIEVETFIKELPKWKKSWSKAKKQFKFRGYNRTLLTRMFTFVSENGIKNREMYRIMNCIDRQHLLTALSKIMKSEFGWIVNNKVLHWYLRVGMLLTPQPKENSARNIMEREVARDCGFITVKECQDSINTTKKVNNGKVQRNKTNIYNL